VVLCPSGRTQQQTSLLTIDTLHSTFYTLAGRIEDLVSIEATTKSMIFELGSYLSSTKIPGRCRDIVLLDLVIRRNHFNLGTQIPFRSAAYPFSPLFIAPQNQCGYCTACSNER